MLHHPPPPQPWEVSAPSPGMGPEMLPPGLGNAVQPFPPPQAWDIWTKLASYDNDPLSKFAEVLNISLEVQHCVRTIVSWTSAQLMCEGKRQMNKKSLYLKKA